MRDSNGTLILANKSWKKIWGLKTKDVLNYKKPRKKLVFNDKDEYLREHINKVKRVYEAGGEYHIQEIKLLHPQKNKAEWIAQYFYSIKNDKGHVERVVILTEDITKRKKNEEELNLYHGHLKELVQERTKELEKEINDRTQAEVKLKKYKDHLEELVRERTHSLQQSEEKYRSVYENMHLGIYRTTPGGKIIMVNPALLEMLKYDSVEELQKRDLENDGYYSKDRRKDFKDEIENNSQVRGFESTWKTSDGKKVFVRENAKALYDTDGNMIYYEGTVEDITEKRKAEEELKLNRERLKTANWILRHDITNDLVVIKSALDIYREEHDKGMLDEIEKRVDKSIKTIQKQKEQEKFVDLHFGLDGYDMRKVVETVINDYTEIVCNIEGQGNAYADNAIYSVFENIINNAIIHGNTKKIDIKISCIENLCEIRFIDYGVGIPDEIKNKVFDEGFHYGKKGNTGIGLYIVQKTVDDYDGMVLIEDNNPQGTVFIVQLRRVIE